MIESPTALHRRAHLPLPTALLHHLLFCAAACKTWQLFEKLLGFFFSFLFFSVLPELNGITAAGAPPNPGQYVTGVLQGPVLWTMSE